MRLHLRAARDLALPLALPAALSVTSRGRSAQLVMQRWDVSQLADIAAWAGVDVEIEIEPLGLEDIFLALHA